MSMRLLYCCMCNSYVLVSTSSLTQICDVLIANHVLVRCTGHSSISHHSTQHHVGTKSSVFFRPQRTAPRRHQKQFFEQERKLQRTTVHDVVVVPYSATPRHDRNGCLSSRMKRLSMDHSTGLTAACVILTHRMYKRTCVAL